MAKHGITKIKAQGESFDPVCHKAIKEVEDTAKKAGTVLEELQAGYKYMDTVIREAMVVVSKKS